MMYRYGGDMSLQSAGSPESAEPHEVIHLGGEAAAIVPLTELRRLLAVERHASPDALDERSHEEVMAELLGSGH
jgi:hypothetical protein